MAVVFTPEQEALIRTVVLDAIDANAALQEAKRELAEVEAELDRLNARAVELSHQVRDMDGVAGARRFYTALAAITGSGAQPPIAGAPHGPATGARAAQGAEPDAVATIGPVGFLANEGAEGSQDRGVVNTAEVLDQVSRLGKSGRG